MVLNVTAGLNGGIPAPASFILATDKCSQSINFTWLYCSQKKSQFSAR